MAKRPEAGRVVMCHIGDEGGRHTITVAAAAVSAHLGHGDAVGQCPSNCVSAAECDDSNACTTDACDSDGACTHASVECDDGNPCTADSCDRALGCIGSATASGSCDDGNDCTAGDMCAAGSCTGSAILGCCRADADCADDDGCTHDVCAAGSCTNGVIDCAVADACIVGFCDSITGGCGSAPVTCDDGNECTHDSCDSASGCAHEPIACDAIAVLRLSEIAPNQTGTQDLIELVVVAAGTVRDTTIEQTGVVLATLPDVTVSAGQVIVVHLNPAAGVTTELTTQAECTDAACYPEAWDVNGGTTGIAYTRRVLAVVDLHGDHQDVAAFSNLTTSPAGYLTELQAVQASGDWLPSTCGGTACTDATTPSANDLSANWTGCGTSPTSASVQRTSPVDTDTKGDWTVAPETFGAP